VVDGTVIDICFEELLLRCSSVRLLNRAIYYEGMDWRRLADVLFSQFFGASRVRENPVVVTQSLEALERPIETPAELVVCGQLFSEVLVRRFSFRS